MCMLGFDSEMSPHTHVLRTYLKLMEFEEGGEL